MLLFDTFVFTQHQNVNRNVIPDTIIGISIL
jgi:hypothetical protein